jgi:hypothetical protein
MDVYDLWVSSFFKKFVIPYTNASCQKILECKIEDE